MDDVCQASPDGVLVKKPQRMGQIVAAGAQPAGVSRAVRDRSIRVHGTVAVVNLRRRSLDGRQTWQTSVLVKEGSRWLRGATSLTPITGAAAHRTLHV